MDVSGDDAADDAETGQTDDSNDEDLMDETEISEQNKLHEHMSDEVNLQTQRDDSFFAAMIDYITTGALPSDKEQAHRIVIQSEFYDICNDQLVKRAVIRGKRLNKIRLAWDQLCVPKQHRM